MLRGPEQVTSNAPPVGRGGVYKAQFPDSPNRKPGFEIRAVHTDDGEEVTGGFSDQFADGRAGPLTFVPDYYPDRFTQTKQKELSRDGRQCGGESIVVDTIKNREFHAKGLLLEYEIAAFQALLDHEGEVEILSPISPSGGMECIIKNGELGDSQGYDPHAQQWLFEYSMDLVSTGKDEYDRGNNEIVSSLIGE